MSIGLGAQEAIFIQIWVSRYETCRYFRELTGSQRTPGFGASQYGIRAEVNDYLGSSVGVVMSLVMIPAS